MKIASWNVNSIKARLGHVQAWLDAHKPDALCIQEIKCKSEDFPSTVFAEMGYHAIAVGQPAYHGVAILAKEPFQAAITRLPGEDSDTQPRYLEADIGGIRLCNLYLPNGNGEKEPEKTDKYDYKLRWCERLIARTRHLLSESVPFMLLGDFNIIPEDRDCHDPAAWQGDALFRPESRAIWRRLIHLGLTDAIRVTTPGDEIYSFWDYQQGAWPRNHGIRIDHALLSPVLADRLVDARIDRAERGREKASDHVPVMVTLSNLIS